MPINVDIVEDGKVVRVTFFDPWKTPDMQPIFDADLAHRDQFQQQHPGQKVHLLVDFTQAKLAADGMLTARRSPSLKHPTSGSTVIVGANTLIQVMANTVFRVSRYDRAVFVKTMDEALAYIRSLED